MKPIIEQFLTTPRHEWTQDMLRAGLDAQLEASGGILTTTARFQRLPRGADAAAGDNNQSVSPESETQAVKFTHDPDRSISGVAMVEEISRTGYYVVVKGMDISEFGKNPVALAQHCHLVPSTLHPACIALIERVSKSGKTLKFHNMTFDTDPLAEAWFQKIMKGFVRMVSIGFVPHAIEFKQTEPAKKDEKPIWFIEFPETELTEISPVVIGANRSAFITKTPRRAKSSDQADQNTTSTSRLAELEKQIQEFSAFMDEVRTIRDRQSDKPLNDLQKALADIETIVPR